MNDITPALEESKVLIEKQVFPLLRQYSSIFSGKMNIEISTPIEDMEQCTDLIISLKNINVAVRLRFWGCQIAHEKKDLTIRASNSYKTEIHKIIEGWGHYYFYGWLNNQKIIYEWMLINLEKMRISGILNDWQTRKLISNTDGKTSFVCYGRREIYNNGCMCIYNGKILK